MKFGKSIRKYVVHFKTFHFFIFNQTHIELTSQLSDALDSELPQLVLKGLLCSVQIGVLRMVQLERADCPV